MNEQHAAEVRASTPLDCWRQFCTLYAFGHAMGWTKRGLVDKDEKSVREHWNKLRKKYLERTGPQTPVT